MSKNGEYFFSGFQKGETSLLWRPANNALDALNALAHTHSIHPQEHTSLCTYIPKHTQEDGSLEQTNILNSRLMHFPSISFFFFCQVLSVECGF